MSWACKVGKKTVRFDDLSPQAWQDIEAASGVEWTIVYTAPLNKLQGGLSALIECVKVAEPDCPDPVSRANDLGSTLGKLSDAFVNVDEDLPHSYEGGLPKEEDDPSTT